MARLMCSQEKEMGKMRLERPKTKVVILAHEECATLTGGTMVMCLQVFPHVF